MRSNVGDVGLHQGVNEGGRKAPKAKADRTKAQPLDLLYIADATSHARHLHAGWVDHVSRSPQEGGVTEGPG